MPVIHPDVELALGHADTVQDHLLSCLDKMRALTNERVSEDRDIAVKVDAHGELIDLWLKPGILDRKPARDIAREITRLVSGAGQDCAAAAAEVFHQAHQVPSYEDYAAAHQPHGSQPRV